jgi:hypothetical protein
MEYPLRANTKTNSWNRIGQQWTAWNSTSLYDIYWQHALYIGGVWGFFLPFSVFFGGEGYDSNNIFLGYKLGILCAQLQRPIPRFRLDLTGHQNCLTTVSTWLHSQGPNSGPRPLIRLSHKRSVVSTVQKKQRSVLSHLSTLRWKYPYRYEWHILWKKTSQISLLISLVYIRSRHGKLCPDPWNEDSWSS